MASKDDELTLAHEGLPVPSAGGGMLLAGLTCSCLAAVVATIIGVFVIPQFAEVFTNFNAPLPLLTRLVMHFYLLVWLVPLGAFCTWRFLPDNRRRNWVVGLIGIGTMVVVLPTMIFALYLPIFAMAATV